MNKISILSLSLKKGGAENQLMKLAVFLKRNKYDVNIIALLKGNDFEEIINENKIKYSFINIKTLSGCFLLFSFFRREKPNLLISFMFAANIIARFIKLFFKIPLITSVRNNNISKLYYLFYKMTYKIDNMTTFNSEYARNKFLKFKITNKEKSILINNAIKINHKLINRGKNEIFTLISIAHFRPQKDYKTLLKAISILKNKNVKVKLLILGHTFNLNWPYKLLDKLNISNEVDIIGFTPNPENYIVLSDTLVLSTLWEGTPNAILEGMAYKLPIISSNVPGCKELVEKSNSGLLFEKENAEDLAHKIMGIINLNQAERDLLGLNGYNYVFENYEESIVFDKWRNIIETTINT